jgi:hypothetical protein
VQAYGGPYGVYGQGTSYGLFGSGFYGVYGSSSQSHGIVGYTSEGSSSGVYGSGVYGARGYGSTAGIRGDSSYVGAWAEGTTWGTFTVATGTSGTNYGIMAETKSSAGYAGYFKGRVHVSGTLSKSAGSFKIDHPLDPENKYLSHSFVESPDMMNIYNGNATLDAKGAAVVTMPNWFEALNRDFRYQLTAIGAPGPNLYVAETIKGNQFKIAGGKPGTQVSWQVTGVRQDAYAKAHPIVVEENKATSERGRFLTPEVYGKPASLGMAVATSPTAGQDTGRPERPMEPQKPDSVAPPRAPGVDR